MKAAAEDHPVVKITADFEKKADAIVAKYPVSKRSATMPLLHFWQETHGYISPQAMDWIAEKLEIAPINVLEIVTFYPMFRQQMVGKYQFKVCRTLSCMLGGSYELFDHLKGKLGIKEIDDHHYGISDDGKFSIEFVECIASCGTAPVMMVNDDFYEDVSNDKADKIVADCS